MPALAAEAVVVAVRSVVMGDDRGGVEEECPEIVDAAAYPQAGRPSVAAAAARPVVRDFRGTDDHGAGSEIDATAEAVAAVTIVLSLIVVVLLPGGCVRL